MPITFHFNSKEKPQDMTEDSLPEGVTEEEFKQQYAKIVYCNYRECFWNTRIEGLKKTKASILMNRTYVPLGEPGFSAVCSRPEIAIQLNTYTIGGSQKRPVPTCFTAAKNGKTGHMDFARLLQSDGSPYGGSLESQHPAIDDGFEGYI